MEIDFVKSDYSSSQNAQKSHQNDVTLFWHTPLITVPIWGDLPMYRNQSVKLWLVWKISRKLYVRPNFVSWAKYIENNCAKLDTFLCSARSVLEKMIGRTALVQRTMQEMLGKYLENIHQTGINTGKSVIWSTKHGLLKKKGQKMLKNTLNT